VKRAFSNFCPLLNGPCRDANFAVGEVFLDGPPSPTVGPSVERQDRLVGRHDLFIAENETPALSADPKLFWSESRDGWSQQGSETRGEYGPDSGAVAGGLPFK
jgi:hypothetical protein